MYSDIIWLVRMFTHKIHFFFQTESQEVEDGFELLIFLLLGFVQRWRIEPRASGIRGEPSTN